jgi:two-component system LytT family response regulator
MTNRIFNCIIVEDELPAARRLQKLIEDNFPELSVIAHLDSIDSTVAWLKHNEAPDLIFLDIQLSDGQSFEIFEQVNVNSVIIFTTAYNEYALEAFKLNSIDYLLKPIDLQELHRSVDKFLRLHRNDDQEDYLSALNKQIGSLLSSKVKYRARFLLTVQDKYFVVPVSDIAYFYSENKITYLMTKAGKKHVVDFTLDELESQLDPGNYFRANRQVIISHSAIDNINSFFNGKMKITVLPRYEKEILISRDKARAFKDWLDT